MRSDNFRCAVFALLLASMTVTAAPGPLMAARNTIKVAVVTPEGSAWVQVLAQWAEQVREQTGGGVEVVIYAGGVSGDEADVLRKMQVGRIHAAGFSGIGLGIIVPDIRVLETPLLFENGDELDAVRERLFDHFSTAFAKKGYVLLGFTEGGWVHLFSGNDISRPETFRSAKMWVWEGDRVAEIFLKICGIRTTPLNIADVSTGLETGMIDSFYAPPLAAVAFQWHARVDYMLDLPVTNAIAALLMTQKAMRQLPVEHQEVLRTLARKYSRKLVEITRRDNHEALSVLQAQGIRVVRPSPRLRAELEEKARKAEARNAQALYSQDLLNRVRYFLKELRGAQTDTP